MSKEEDQIEGFLVKTSGACSIFNNCFVRVSLCTKEAAADNANEMRNKFITLIKQNIGDESKNF